MQTSAKIISVLFHPLFLFFYLIVIAYHFDPYGYQSTHPKAIGLMFIMSFFTLVLFPAVTVALLKALNFIPSFSMPDKEHRIAPLIGTCVFYIWYFVNVKNNVAFPPSLVFVALGGAIATGLAFFINNFSKISLHAVGSGAFLMAIAVLAFYTGSKSLSIDAGYLGHYEVSTIILIIGSIVLAGLIGSAAQHQIE